ncbi:TetR/AcrR family transcriptional regulator C-terminal domain-containing protein [Streptomyces sp. NPDC001568]|uniref:TetR/AcrR family transcriptional regulator C-terminal domain-containing protein n=1 Tax=Streptomyces sp. NPDC001568 TaxID=3364588 RepID=UPI0036C728CF
MCGGPSGPSPPPDAGARPPRVSTGTGSPRPPCGSWPERLREPARGYRRLLAEHAWPAPLSVVHPNIGPHARAFDAALRRLLDEAGLVGAGRTGAHLAVSQFLTGSGPNGCGGFARRAPDADFDLALDVLIAGIRAGAGPTTSGGSRV